jgi:hypothetical protein
VTEVTQEILPVNQRFGSANNPKDTHEAREGSAIATGSPASTAAVLLSLLSLVAYVRLGSESNALAFIAGDRPLVNSTVRSFARIAEGEERSFNFEIVNFTGKPVTILGFRSSCTCVLVERLPLVVPAGNKERVNVVLNSQGKSGPLEGIIILYTSCPRKPQLGLKIVGDVSPSVPGKVERRGASKS